MDKSQSIPATILHFRLHHLHVFQMFCSQPAGWHSKSLSPAGHSLQCCATGLLYWTSGPKVVNGLGAWASASQLLPSGRQCFRFGYCRQVTKTVNLFALHMLRGLLALLNSTATSKEMVWGSQKLQLLQDRLFAQERCTVLFL